MQEKNQSFEDLEKQMARDTLEQALKALHEEINREIAKNKNEFSSTIQKTLSDFRRNVEKSISEEINKNLSSLFENNIYAISQEVKKSFEKTFDPVLENTKNDMKRLHIQGEKAINAWEKMISQYKALWNKPFFIIFSASILTGTLISFLSSYYLTRSIRETMQTHENLLVSYKNLSLDYFEREKTREKEMKKKNNNKNNNQSTDNKKKK